MDARASMVEGENIMFEGSKQLQQQQHQQVHQQPGSGSQKFDFEWAKQKFDRSGQHIRGGGGGGASSGSGKNSAHSKANASVSSKRISANCESVVGDSNRDMYMMKTSLNLDDLKVSDDDVSRIEAPMRGTIRYA